MSSSVQSLRISDISAGEKPSAAGPGALARAVALHLAGKREEALDQLQRAASANQGSAEIFRAMGHIEFELERYDDAAKSYRALTRLKPQYAQGWFNLAVCLERSGGWDKAAEAFHNASTLDPANPDAHLGLAVCYMRLEDPKSALRGFERCLELAPDHEDAVFGKGTALQALGSMDEAGKIYAGLLERNPESEEPLSNLILIGMAKRDYDAVRQHSERLLDLHPDSTAALEGLAAWACAAGDQALAAKFCTLLVSAAPAHFEGWFNLALAHQKASRWKQSAECYDEALKVRPQ